MDCQTARDVLADVTREITHPEEEVEEAIRHVAACDACQVGLRSLATAILSTRHDTIPCAEARDRFFDYCMAPQEGRTITDELAAVRYHLETCPTCAAEFKSLQEMLVWAEEEPLHSNAKAPQFDLSFVDKTPPLWEQATDKVNRLGEAIHIWISERTATLGDVSPGLAALQLTPAYALRGAEDLPSVADSLLTIPDEAHDVQIHIGVGGTSETEADLSVVVESLSPERPLPRIRVSLEDAGRHLLERQHATGGELVTFEKLTPAHYWLVVQADELIWEVSVPISAEREE